MRLGTWLVLAIGLLAAPALAQESPVVQVGGPVPVEAGPPPAAAGHMPPGPAMPFAPAYTDGPAPPPLPFVPPIKHRTFGSIEYLLFKLRGNPTPSLVQTVPNNVTPQTNPFPPDAAADTFGGNGIDLGRFNGLRLTFGHWLDAEGCHGYDFSFAQFFEKEARFETSSNNFPQIGRSYFNTGSNVPVFVFNAIGDGSQRASIVIDSPVRYYTGDFNVRRRGVAVLADRFDWFVGGRYLDLRDSVNISNSVQLFDQNGVQTRSLTSSESFRAENQFYGLQFGGTSRYDWGCFHLDFTGKIAFGGTQQHVSIVGSAIDQTAGQAVNVLPNQSILLVQTTNAGEYDRGKFAYVAEFIARVGYQLSPNAMVTVGYDLLSISSVQRSGNAISTNINPANAPFLIRRDDNNPNALGPVFNFRGTDFYAHGLTVGLTLSY